MDDNTIEIRFVGEVGCCEIPNCNGEIVYEVLDHRLCVECLVESIEGCELI